MGIGLKMKVEKTCLYCIYFKGYFKKNYEFCKKGHKAFFQDPERTVECPDHTEDPAWAKINSYSFFKNTY